MTRLLKILVVEDDVVVLNLLVEFLIKSGFKTKSAKSAEVPAMNPHAKPFFYGTFYPVHRIVFKDPSSTVIGIF